MKIKDVVCSGGLTGFYFDDQRAIKAHGVVDGAMYMGDPITSGFEAIRQKGESISIMLVLEDGQIAYGDCAAVQYSGAGGRDPLFVAQAYIEIIERYIKPVLIGESLDSFKRLAHLMDTMVNPQTNQRFHTAIRYGVTQALLDGVAKANHKLMVEVIAQEYDLEISETPIKLFTQSGDDRYLNVDKMIIKEAAVLPHGLINHVPTKLGHQGELLLDYLRWLSQRILEKRMSDDYHPIIHIDVYGTLGMIFEGDHDQIVAYLKAAEAAAQPFDLYLEGPMDVEDKVLQINQLKTLRQQLEAEGSKVKLVADEWCNTLEDIKDFVDAKAGHVIQIKTPDLGGINNTIEAILYCKAHGMLAYLGGTCNETDRSSQISVHIALATQPDQMLAKPGMGVDEGLMITYNEMARTLALLKAKSNSKS